MNTGIKIGDTFLIQTGTQSDPLKKHLHFVITSVENGKCIAVPLQTLKEGLPYDKSCVLKQGDHEFIKHDSWVAYDKACFLYENTITLDIAQGRVKRKMSLSESVLKKIIVGAIQSERLTRRYKNIIICQQKITT
ncbi:MAG: hypothetical protein ACK5LE_09190 [Alphaproteobacteria bacterium]